MEDIAPEYDVVVLGTGKFPPIFLSNCLLTASPRLDRVCAFWVCRFPWIVGFFAVLTIVFSVF